jgi:inorganic pyrophosphatase
MPNYAKLPTLTEEKLIRLVIETPRGSAAKFSYDPELHVFEYSHPLPAGITYPYDWGFIPSTLGEDGDPLDGLVIHQAATAPGMVIQCQLMGALRVEQSEKGESFRNDRFFFCPVKMDGEDQQVTAEGLTRTLKDEIEQFFKASVLNSDKLIKFEGWQSPDDALKAIKKGRKAYLRKNGK